jgi:hypothetical protein
MGRVLTIVVGDLEDRDHLGDQDMDGRIITELIVKKVLNGGLD